MKAERARALSAFRADPSEWVRSVTLDAGFDSVRIARADQAWDAGERLAAWLAAEHHGSMGWIAETFERRKHPTAMWAEARTAIVTALNYGPSTDPLKALEHTDRAAISVYAQDEDYHRVLKKRLKAAAGEIARVSGAEVKVFVDTAPLMEKPLAQRAGLGWQGKHTNLVSRGHGSWLFLGSILTDLDLRPDAPEVDHCGRCTACLDICPTRAFPAPYVLDARRCISYLTIEHEGPIPTEFRAAMGNRIYGCDDCLAVCPWNKFAQVASETALASREEAPSLAALLELDEETFRQRFRATAIRRIGRARLVRNVLIAAGNSRDASLLSRVEALLCDPDASVRGAAVWALRRLAPQARIAALRERHLGTEAEAVVREEWTCP
jgi:epoxyqueuosine reductase